MADLKILYGYSYFASAAYSDVEQMNLGYIQRLRDFGFDVEGFCLTLNPPGPCLSFPELDSKWKRGDKDLLRMYMNLEKALKGKDVFLNASGINLHPQFVNKLPVFTVFQCFDDPENSHNLSEPVASAYDLCLVGNIAEVNTYRQWGIERVEWIPMGLQPGIYDSTLTYDQILNGDRDIDLFMMIDREIKYRKDRIEQLANAFPTANFYGRGWPKGYLPNEDVVSYLVRSKIGPNIHNSTGPINFRTYYLPANGVLQICDNKKYLGEIYEIDREVVGYDTIDECIELCRYYLDHDEERRKIAANGWKRAIEDYSEYPVFLRTVNIIRKYLGYRETRPYECDIAEKRDKLMKKRQYLNALIDYPLKIAKKGKNFLKKNRER
jgi:spore maturation protein CgeB